MSSTSRRPRRLRFDSLDDVLRAAEEIAGARSIEQLGNWTPGQVFEHLARAYHSSIDQSQARLPLINCIIAKLLKPLLLRFGLPSGVSIERTSDVAADEFLPSDDIATAHGLDLLKDAICRISRTRMTARHNLFGKMSHKQWLQMHCRHAELHIGFLLVQHSD